MHTASKMFAIAALILAPAACGGGSSSGAGGSTTTTTGTGGTSTGTSGTKACNDQAAAVCTLRDKCIPDFEIARTFGTEAACQSRTAQTCINALDAKGQANTATHVEACAAAYPSESCADFFDGNPAAACVAPAGTQPMGAACGASGQCTTTYCAVSSTAVCGTCKALPIAGASCQVQADCGRDLACATPTVAGDGGVPTSGVCAAWVDSGGACLTGYNPCKEGLSCVGDNESMMTMGTCQTAGAAAGAACQTTRKTVAGCADGFVCIAPAGANGMGSCAAVTLVGMGGTCGNIGTPVTSVVQCSTSGLCKKAAPNDATGICVAAAADGAPCDNDAAIGPPCLTPAKCVVPSGSSATAGTCTVPNAATCG